MSPMGRRWCECVLCVRVSVCVLANCVRRILVARCVGFIEANGHQKKTLLVLIRAWSESVLIRTVGSARP